MTALIDTNAFLGRWPFALAPELTSKQLVSHLARSGVRRAIVSDLGGVFQPEPMAANRALFAAVRRQRSLVPVPIINPSLATWREHLDLCLAATRLRAVRVLPNYHGYSLRSPRLDGFMTALASAKVKLVLTVRLEDERQKYFALRIHGVAVEAIGVFLKRFPAHQVLCTGCYGGELRRLAAEHDNFSADLSFAESLTTLEELRKTIPLRRLMFGSCAPLLSVHAQAAKIFSASLPNRQLALVAAENARRFFSL